MAGVLEDFLQKQGVLEPGQTPMAGLLSLGNSLRKRRILQDPANALKQRGYEIDEDARRFMALPPEERDARVGMNFAPGAIGATVYHGSPHKFEKFDLGKIGTGEGNAAYGHGLYLAENPEVSKQYAKQVKDMGAVKDANEEMSRLAKIMQADQVPGAYRKYKTQAGKDAAAQYDALMQKRETIVNDPGNLYKVDLPDEHIAKMLDWDKPLSQQTPEVQNALRTAQLAAPDYHANLSGESIYRMRPDVPPAEVSRRMRDAGIPGIRYLDAGSRGPTGTGRWKVTYKNGESEIYDYKINDDVLRQMGATAEPHGTSNYVSFHDEILKILGRE